MSTYMALIATALITQAAEPNVKEQGEQMVIVSYGSAVESKYFTEFVKLAFSHRRKQLASVMKNAPAPYGKDADAIRALLLQIGATETARPEELSIPQWVQLASLWKNS